MSKYIDEKRLVIGALAIIAFATVVLVIIPYLQLKNIAPPDGLKPYTESQARGREVYMSNGCVYCHSQQPRSANLAPDEQRGWGRAPTTNDYAYDQVHLLGTMRTGPDLFNIGARQSSEDWHLGHLYQPRAYVPTSNMPAFPFLFIETTKVKSDDVVVHLPPAYTKDGTTIIASQAALDLVEYLKGMDHTYPIKKSIAESLKVKQPIEAK